MQNITNKLIYKKALELQHEMAKIKKIFLEEPELLQSFIARMKHVDAEKSIRVEDFGKRYGLK